MTYDFYPNTSAIYLTDSYKLSHFYQYPPNTQYVQSYLESRGGEYDELVIVGLQYYLKKYLSKPITMEDVYRVEHMCKLHGEPFNKEGWLYIVNECAGLIPIRIKSVPEGTILKPKDIILTIENTDPMVPWLTSYLETLLLKIWYPITVASKSHHVRKIISKYHQQTMDDLSGVDFAYHSFGDRGSSSVESAELAGASHLTQFKGTDNFSSLFMIRDYYNDDCAGFSIAASEHSTVTCWTKDSEYVMINNYLEESKDRGLGMIACVMDSYDVLKAVNYVTSDLKEKIESNEYPIFVIRPDSGDPIDIINKILNIMVKNDVKYTVNSKGYKLFDKFRLIWGDGITPSTIEQILETITRRGFAAGNCAFGSGGDLVQNVTRDTCKFAVKACAATINDIDVDVYKDPITDKGKASKRGRQTLVAWKSGWHDKQIAQVQSIRLDEYDPNNQTELLQDVFVNGKIVQETTFAEIRERALKS